MRSNLQGDSMRKLVVVLGTALLRLQNYAKGAGRTKELDALRAEVGEPG